LSQYPALEAQGISAYTTFAPSYNYTVGNTSVLVNGFAGIYMLPILHPSNSSNSLTAAITTLINNATASNQNQFIINITSELYPDFYAWYLPSNGPRDAGVDVSLGSRLLDVKALTQNVTATVEAYKAACPLGSSISVYLVSGRGVWNAVPRGGSNAVNPAWRKALVHSGKSILNFS
jgi:hypothetical protein